MILAPLGALSKKPPLQTKLSGGSMSQTVSAFSNYDGGTILFGVDDDGNVKGLPDVKQACLDIENKINDSISPQPDYTLEGKGRGTKYIIK